MSKISLRWRITILMGILVLVASVLLTFLSIYNMTDNFVTPIIYSSAYIGESDSNGKGSLEIPFADDPRNLPGGIHYVPELNLDVENARQSFSLFSYLYLALVIAGSMIAAYYLAGRAMQPISELNEEIETMDGKSLSKRLSIPQTKDEIENLSRSFNELFERLERDFEKEKRFSANAAHELKTPLATIMTSAQVLKLSDHTTAEEYRENLDITLQSVRRLSNVLDGLLMLGRPVSEVTFEPVSISQMLHEIEEEIKPCYYEKNISLTYDLQTDVLTGNQLLLYRAFFNLIENAYKYTEKDGSITIASCCSGAETIIRISDTGIGIPADDIKNIFEPFYRADKSRSRKIAGAGLGLSIAKEIFDLHKATVSVANRNEGGTVVEVRFRG
ncbi:HAMP domain-containing sensor histidine kinase [Hydrogenoanaerobacterium sp.]|uniref:sensor histidine kinase n=1 Tax=Hydrogenoanaerobacterium sp. TaxID=2953763 RepID=UPI00289EFE57|nr:HAMP domain-containing sensor histidine kinase [Hydrogenoanaerobacterium sp.]